MFWPVIGLYSSDIGLAELWTLTHLLYFDDCQNIFWWLETSSGPRTGWSMYIWILGHLIPCRDILVNIAGPWTVASTSKCGSHKWIVWNVGKLCLVNIWLGSRRTLSATLFDYLLFHSCILRLWWCNELGKCFGINFISTCSIFL